MNFFATRQSDLRVPVTSALLLLASLLGGCSAFVPPQISYDTGCSAVADSAACRTIGRAP